VSQYRYFIGVSLGEGAIPDHFRALANELVRRGHEVVLLPWGAGAKEQARSGNPAVVPWPSKRPTKLQDAMFLLKLIRRHRPHCVIGNFGAVNVMMLIGWLARVPQRIAWYRTLSGPIVLDWKGPMWLLSFLNWRKKLVYRLCTHIIGNSKAAVDDVCRVYGVPQHKCLFFYNTLSDPLQTIAVPHEKREGLVVCAGRFHPCKGQDVLVEAAAIARKQVASLGLCFLGAGPLLDECAERARKLGIDGICEFKGSVPHDQVLRQMAEASVTAVPSRDEAFGLVALESMAVGTPVVASRVGGLAEIVRDGIDGFLVPPDDPKALAEKLAVLLSDREIRDQIGRNARQRFLDTFEQSKVVQEQANWFERIVAEAVQRG